MGYILSRLKENSMTANYSRSKKYYSSFPQNQMYGTRSVNYMRLRACSIFSAEVSNSINYKCLIFIYSSGYMELIRLYHIFMNA